MTTRQVLDILQSSLLQISPEPLADIASRVTDHLMRLGLSEIDALALTSTSIGLTTVWLERTIYVRFEIDAYGTVSILLEWTYPASGIVDGNHTLFLADFSPESEIIEEVEMLISDVISPL